MIYDKAIFYTQAYHNGCTNIRIHSPTAMQNVIKKKPYLKTVVHIYFYDFLKTINSTMLRRTLQHKINEVTCSVNKS